MKQFRMINLLGATGQTRFETLSGRKHLVVPVVALVEGVIHAVNSPRPEYVPARVLSAAPGGWNGRPVFAGHPMRDGEPISGNLPEVLETALGKCFNAHYDDKRLLMEAWIDVETAQETDEGTRLLERCENEEPIEVSIGALVTMEEKTGTFGGKKYAAEWLAIAQDHLALLNEEQIGACSIKAGCGALRTNLVTATGVQTLEGEEEIERALGHEDQPRDENGRWGGGDGAPHRDAAARHKLAADAHKSAMKAHAGGSDDALSKSETALKASSKAASATSKLPYDVNASEDSNMAHLHSSDAHTAASGGQSSSASSSHRQAYEAHKNAARGHKTTANRIDRIQATGRRHGIDPSGRTRRLEGGEVTEKKSRIARWVEKLRAMVKAKDMSNRDLTAALEKVLRKASPNSYPSIYVEAYEPVTDPTRVIFTSYDDGDYKMFAQDFTLGSDGAITLSGERKEVEPLISYEEITTGKDEVTAAQQRDACACRSKGEHASQSTNEGVNMNRTERIAALLGHKHSIVKSQKALEAMTDDELVALESSANAAQKAVEDKNEAARIAAKKVEGSPEEEAEESEEEEAAEQKEKAKGRSASAKKKVKTEAEWLEEAPQHVRDLYTRTQAAEKKEKDRLVALLEGGQKTFSKAQLEAKSTEELEQLVSLAGLDESSDDIDFSLNPVATPRAASDTSNVYRNPPDSYRIALEKRAKN